MRARDRQAIREFRPLVRDRSEVLAGLAMGTLRKAHA